jgi:hypothetical protein
MRTFSRPELINAVGDVAFETQHFRCFSTLKDDPKLRAFSAAASQAVGYSLLIHLRVLMDFFFAVIVLLNKRLAHMTATRWEDPPKSWDYYNQYAPTILDLITKFEKGAPR